MEHLKSEKDVCLICLQFLNEELNDLSDISTLELELRQNVFNKTSKYLSSVVFYPCLQWNFTAERSSPICQNCYSSVENVFKLHEMVENLEQKILEFVDSFTSEVVQHHNQLKDVYNSGDDPYLDSNNVAGEKITEIVYEPDNDIDIKEDGGYNSEYELGTWVPSGETADEDDESLDAENFDPIVDDVIADPENSAVDNTVFSSNTSTLDTTELANRNGLAIQYPGLHLKQLRVTLTRLQLDLGANISKPWEKVTRPKRKAALAATAALEKIHWRERNLKKRKLKERNESDTDWEEDGIQSDRDSDSDGSGDDEILPGDKTNSDDNATNSTQRSRRPTIFEMAKRFKCQSEFCQMSFNFTKELNWHSSESGHENPKLYKCDRKNCSKEFFNKSSMKNHVKIHHKKSQFNCKSCHKIFIRKRDLQIHQYKSHMEKLFKCDHCEQAFTRKVNLTNHKKLHAGKHFECKLCPAIYLWKISLKMHIQIAHNGEMYKCNLCGTKCKSKAHLTNHRLTHFKRKLKNIFPCAACKKIHFVENIWDSCIIKHFRKDKQAGFICAICTSVFKTSMYLDHHAKKSGHLNKKLYLCGICKKRFYRREDLRRHKKCCSNGRNVKVTEPKPFKCKICWKGYGDKYNFHDHIEWHRNPDKFKCMDCGKQYRGRYQFRQHRKIHGDVKYHTCKVCKQKFQRGEFKIHCKTCRPIRIHLGATSLKCIFCDIVLENEEKLNIHLRSHKGKIPCKFCGRILKKKPLRKHLKTHSTEYDYKCDKCERAFNTKDKLERHEISAHTDERPFACTDCDAKFKSKAVLNMHFLKHSTENLCDICGKKFSRPDILKKHKKQTHDKDLFKCTYETCDRKFYERALLTEHIKVVHTKEVQYLCEVCQKTFTTKKNFKDHMRNHTGEKLFPCTRCDKSFFLKARLNFHIASNHSEKKLNCNICKKTFALNYKLQQHIHYVHGEKKFQCEFCPFLCADRGRLTKHRKINHTHSNERPFICEICGKSYKEKHHLIKHFKLHDKVKKTERELADTESESD